MGTTFSPLHYSSRYTGGLERSKRIKVTELRPFYATNCLLFQGYTKKRKKEKKRKNFFLLSVFWDIFRDNRQRRDPLSDTLRNFTFPFFLKLYFLEKVDA